MKLKFTLAIYALVFAVATQAKPFASPKLAAEFSQKPGDDIDKENRPVQKSADPNPITPVKDSAKYEDMVRDLIVKVGRRWWNGLAEKLAEKW